MFHYWNKKHWKSSVLLIIFSPLISVQSRHSCSVSSCNTLCTIRIIIFPFNFSHSFFFFLQHSQTPSSLPGHIFFFQVNGTWTTQSRFIRMVTQQQRSSTGPQKPQTVWPVNRSVARHGIVVNNHYYKMDMSSYVRQQKILMASQELSLYMLTAFLAKIRLETTAYVH